MKIILSLLCIFLLVVAIGAAPIVETGGKNARQGDAKDGKQSDDDVLDNLEYGRYLKEVVDILESDPEFKRKLENASVDDIKSGNIAEHLPLVQHNIRSRLDEAKQREIARLRDLVGNKMRILNERQRLALARGDSGRGRMKEFLPQHIDTAHSETFGQLDLERLIRHATQDLDELDRKREEQFKQYELRKEYQRRAKLAKMNNEERRRLEKLHQEVLEKKKRHRKVNHPGSVRQMEEVWEQVDRLEPDQFAPKTFFQLHDINGDGFLDDAELEAIMLKEAAKIYDDAPDADLVEKQEEMDRMRLHVMKEFDKNNDRMVSLEEFQRGISGKDARNDQGWKSIEDNPVYSDQEYENFSSRFSPMSTPIARHQTQAPPVNQPGSVAPESVPPPPPPPPVSPQQQLKVQVPRQL